MQLSSFSTGLISLVLSDAATGGGPGVPANASAVVLAIQTRHTDRFRITARTAYIATSPSSPTPASTASQAAVILSALAAGTRTLSGVLMHCMCMPTCPGLSRPDPRATDCSKRPIASISNFRRYAVHAIGIRSMDWWFLAAQIESVAVLLYREPDISDREACEFHCFTPGGHIAILRIVPQRRAEHVGSARV